MKMKSYGNIAIVGAGATGIAVFIALVRHRAAKKITLIDPHVAGQGIVYANTDPGLLCNTSVDLMSVLPPEHNDLLNYLHNQGQCHITAKDFISRQQIGMYIRDRFSDYLKTAQSYGIEVTQVHDQVLRVVRAEDNHYLIQTNNKRMIPASKVIICNGYSRPIVPDIIGPYISHPSVCTSPYPERDLQQKLSPYSRVLVLGSKLSAIDASLTLCKNRHIVTLTSSSGKFPAVRTCLVRSSDEVSSFSRAAAADIDYHVPGYEQKLYKLVNDTVAMITALPLKDQIAFDPDAISLLRKETELARSDKTHWQYVLIALVDALNFVIKPQDRKLIQEIKQLYRELLSRYLSSVPLQTSQKLLEYIDNDHLHLVGGQLAKVELSENEWLVSWESGESRSFDAIVCATGQHAPKYDAKPESITFVNDTEQTVTYPELATDLSVKLPEATKSERIWFVGIPAHISVPAVYAFYIGVRQANEVAQRIAESEQKCEWTERIEQEW
jgi:uncharacterized NAD(P)/FAD-binding protein YdhS